MSVNLEDFSFLDGFSQTMTPTVGPQYPDNKVIKDGDYSWTVLCGVMDHTKNTRDAIVRIEVFNEDTKQVGDKVYFISDEERFNRLLGDLQTMGIDTASWKGKADVAGLLANALESIRGKRFKGTKKTSRNHNYPDKPWHNIYVNAALPPAETTDHLPPERVSTSPASGGDDNAPF